MTESVWLLQVYQLTDLASRDAAGSLLTAMPALTVDPRSCERGHFLIVDCPDATQAMAVYELVMMADPDAELIHSTTGKSQVETVKQRINRDAATGPAANRDLLDA